MSTRNPFRFYNRVTVENDVSGISSVTNNVFRASMAPELEACQGDDTARSFVPSSFMHNVSRRSQAPRIIFDRSDFTQKKTEKHAGIRAVEKRLDMLEEENRSLRQQIEEVRQHAAATPGQDLSRPPLSTARSSTYKFADDRQELFSRNRPEQSRHAASATYLGACNSPLLSAGNPLKSPSVYACVSPGSPISARRPGSPRSSFQRRSSVPLCNLSPCGSHMSFFSAAQAFHQSPYAIDETRRSRENEMRTRQPYTAREARYDRSSTPLQSGSHSPTTPPSFQNTARALSPRLRLFGKLSAPPLHTLASSSQAPTAAPESQAPQAVFDSKERNPMSVTRGAQLKTQKRGPSAVFPLQPGSRVTVQGLKTNREINGKCADVLSFDPTVGRWKVRLDSGDIVRIAVHNLNQIR